MDNSAEVATLRELGMTRYEAMAYLALIGRDDASPAEIARLGGLPRQRVYDVLSSLAARDLVAAVPGRTLRYRAQPPDDVTERLLAVRRRELDQTAERSTELASQLLPRFVQGQDRAQPLDYVEVLRDRHHAVRRVERLWDQAEHDVMVFVCPPYLAPPHPEEATVPQGIRQRSIYEFSLLDDAQMVRLLEVFAEQGEQVRLTSTLPMKVTIIDGQSVAFNLPDPVEAPDSVTTLVVHHSALAETLTLAFETVWAQSISLEEALRQRTSSQNPRRRRRTSRA